MDPTDATFLDLEDAEDVERFLGFLVELSDDPSLSKIAFMHYYEGSTCEVICREFNISPRFARRLDLIRKTIELFEARLRADSEK